MPVSKRLPGNISLEDKLNPTFVSSEQKHSPVLKAKSEFTKKQIWGFNDASGRCIVRASGMGNCSICGCQNGDLLENMSG